MRFNLREFYSELQEKGVIFCFSGPISQAVIEGVGGTLRQKMELEETDFTITQKVFAVFVEQMQNIINYSAEKSSRDAVEDGDIRTGVLIIGHEESRYYVLCGNKVANRNIEQIKNHLDPLQTLDKNELKSLYRERRKMSSLPESKGAGLGFIEMARKVSLPIEYEFVPMEDDYSFFCLKATI
jgi:hypothetical protein